jgi:hypothetical protein
MALTEKPKKTTVSDSPLRPSKVSPYIEGGSPVTCFLPSCGKPFVESCFHAKNGHFYCSHVCADEGQEMDLSHVQLLRRNQLQ